MTAALDHPGVTLSADHLIGLRSIALHRNETPPLSALPGGMIIKKRGQGQEISDVREYVNGDDIRHLDRGSTARTGVLHVRSFQEDRDSVTVMVADFRPSMMWGSRRAFRSVAAAEALALIGWRVIRDGGRVGLFALGAEEPVAITARGRVRGMLAVIGGLVWAHEMALRHAKSGPTADPSLDAGLARVARIVPKGADVVIASGFDTPGNSLGDQLGQLARRGAARLIRIDDAAAVPPPGLYPVRLPDGSKRRMRVTGAAHPKPQTDGLAEFPSLRVDAGGSLTDMARQIDRGFLTAKTRDK